MLTETKKKAVKNQKLKFKIFKKKKKNQSGDMMDRYLSLKSGVIHLTVSEKTMSTDGRTTNGRRAPRHDSSSAVQ